MTAVGKGSTPLISARSIKWLKIAVCCLCFVGLGAAFYCNMGNGPDASPEWQYTTKMLNRVWAPIFCVVLIFASGILKIFFRLRSIWALFAFALLSLIFFAVPVLAPMSGELVWQAQIVLSLCWVLGFISAGILFFMLAARLGSFGAWAGCFLGSIMLGLGVGELWFLCTAQTADGLVNNSVDSKYVLAGEASPETQAWENGQCGFALAAHSGSRAIAHRGLRKDQILFDVKYGLDEKGRRFLPEPAGPVENNLLLFGCSFTFGHGLEDEQSWPFLLAWDLGPTWKVENYSANGYGPAQMLCLLENHMLEPPQAANRYAIFLGIWHQLLRNDFFLNGPHYVRDASGKPVQSGKPRYGKITNLGRIMNGSQLTREVVAFLTAGVAKDNQDFIQDYLAMLRLSAQLLASEYNTKLYVLLWPDLAWLQPDIERLGISCLQAKDMLPDWDEDEGHKYRIHPLYESHPNAAAASLIAAGLAKDFKSISAKKESANHER